MTSRSELRRARRNLTTEQQRRAATQLARIVTRELFFQRATKIAAYLPFDGEIDPLPILLAASKLGKRCFLPTLSNDLAQPMTFQEYLPHKRTRVRSNRYGIDEPLPERSKAVPAKQLDVIFLPLVGFDLQGNRIGMGKGYYDRVLAGHRDWWRKPLLVGLAHSCQQTEIVPNSWDVPVNKIATELTLWSFPN
jgi:5-formyltetrahydrofolate cyclo-ligase